jgi:hypothetical protein
MRPTVRRIDLTQSPTAVEVWPSLDWLEPTGEAAPRRRSVTFGSAPSSAPTLRGPQGRSGLWDAMANAVQRARESSRTDSGLGCDDLDPFDELEGDGAEILEMTVDTPHLAYLARVACRNTTRDNLPGADIIALVDNRRADAS